MSLALSNLLALAAPANGTYVIYNRVLSPTGDKLALSYNGENQYVTAEPLKLAQNQLVSLFDDWISLDDIIIHFPRSVVPQQLRCYTADTQPQRPQFPRSCLGK